MVAPDINIPALTPTAAPNGPPYKVNSQMFSLPTIAPKPPPTNGRANAPSLEASSVRL